MLDFIRNVSEIGSSDRQALERLLGRQLRENQQLIIHVVSIDIEPTSTAEQPQGGGLPDWLNVYDGLSDQEIADLEGAVLTRADLSRPTE